MMKIYLAHNFSAREFLPSVVSLLTNLGFDCTSTWIFDDAHAKGGSRLASAMVDLQDIDRSNYLVLFTDQYGATPGKGKYVELGYAYAKEKRIILVGTDESCVFYALPGVVHLKDVDDLIEYLSKKENQ